MLRRALGVLLMFACSVGCTQSNSYVERWSGVNLDNDLEQLVVINEGFTESYFVVHGIYSGSNASAFLKEHSLRQNTSGVDYVDRKFSTYTEIDQRYRKSTSPQNLFTKTNHHKEEGIVVEIYYDSGNESVWLVVASGG